MHPRLLAVAAFNCVVVIASGCSRRTSPPPPKPLPQVPAPLPSASLSSMGAPSIADLVEKVRPSVVNITAVHEVAVHARPGGWPFEGMFPPDGRGLGGRDEVLRQTALGSGFILDRQGHVVTNAHVIDSANVVEVKLLDNRQFRARTVAKDQLMDIAVIQLEHAPSDLPVASLGSSDAMKVGDYVVAIGNPFGLGDTVTTGIVSAKGRVLGAGPYDDFIQTDASINPGNSGGPLFDLRGQVVGIDTAINPEGQGIGFAIPIDEVKRVLPELIATGRIARGRLGVTIQGMDDSLAKALGLDRPRGALVANVQAGGPAANAGIRAGDVILLIDGDAVAQALDLPRMVAAHAPGSRVRLTILRDKEQRDVEVTLGAVQPPGGGVASKQAPSTSGDGGEPGTLGIEAGNARGGGALVVSVMSGSPADGKLAPGDVIESMNHERVTSAADLAAKLAALPAGSLVVLRVREGNGERYVAVALG